MQQATRAVSSTPDHPASDARPRRRCPGKTAPWAAMSCGHPMGPSMQPRHRGRGPKRPQGPLQDRLDGLQTARDRGATMPRAISQRLRAMGLSSAIGPTLSRKSMPRASRSPGASSTSHAIDTAGCRSQNDDATPASTFCPSQPAPRRVSARASRLGRGEPVRARPATRKAFGARRSGTVHQRWSG